MWGYVLLIYNDVCDIHFVYGVHVYYTFIMADNCHTQRNFFHQALALINSQQLKSEVMADEWCTMLLPSRVWASFMYKCKQNGKRLHNVLSK